MQAWSAPVFIGLGSNLDDPTSQIEAATRLLHAPAKGIACEKRSPLYRSAAMYDRAQPDFVNCVCLCRSRLCPLSLLEHLQGIERALGRKQTSRFGPRCIDLDILYYGNRIVRSPRLTIPHPRARERPFVLVPLCALQPDFLDPEVEQSAQALLEAITSETLAAFPCQPL